MSSLYDENQLFLWYTALNEFELNFLLFLDLIYFIFGSNSGFILIQSVKPSYISQEEVIWRHLSAIPQITALPTLSVYSGDVVYSVDFNSLR